MKTIREYIRQAYQLNILNSAMEWDDKHGATEAQWEAFTVLFPGVLAGVPLSTPTAPSQGPAAPGDAQSHGGTESAEFTRDWPSPLGSMEYLLTMDTLRILHPDGHVEQHTRVHPVRGLDGKYPEGSMWVNQWLSHCHNLLRRKLASTQGL